VTRTKSDNKAALSMVNPGAGAIDIGSTMHMAAINPSAADKPVREFGTFTGDLHEMARWFKASGVTSVAMESTGVSQPMKCWRPTASMLFWSTRGMPRMCLAAKPM
jgi:transposase